MTCIRARGFYHVSCWVQTKLSHLSILVFYVCFWPFRIYLRLYLKLFVAQYPTNRSRCILSALDKLRNETWGETRLCTAGPRLVDLLRDCCEHFSPITWHTVFFCAIGYIYFILVNTQEPSSQNNPSRIMLGQDSVSVFHEPLDASARSHASRHCLSPWFWNQIRWCFILSMKDYHST